MWFNFILFVTFMVTLQTVLAQVTYQQGLKVPKTLPSGSFAIHTLVDIDTVDYSEDYDVGSATAVCGHRLRHSGVNPPNHVTAPCLTTVDKDDEQFILCRCRIRGSVAENSSSYVHIHLYINDQTGNPTVEFTTNTGIGTPYYAIGKSPTKMLTGTNSFDNPDQVIWINCVNNQTGPIAG